MATAICLLGFTPMVCAQDAKVSKTRYYRHEVSIGGGRIYPDEDPYDGFENRILNDFPVYEFPAGLVSGGTGVFIGSYYYHFDKWLSVGALTVYKKKDYSFRGYYKDEQIAVGYDYVDGQLIPICRTEKTMVEGGGNRIKEKSFFLMPSVKLSWLNNSWCSLYTKVLLGWHYQRLKFKSDVFPKEETSKYDKSGSEFVSSVVPIGIEIGKQKVRWNFELGLLGSMEYFQMGLSYRFVRYGNK